MPDKKTYPFSLTITLSIKEKINSRFKFIKISWIIFYIFLAFFFSYDFKLLLQSQTLSILSGKNPLRISGLILCILIFFIAIKLETFIVKSFKRSFIMEINLKSNDQFEFITIDMLVFKSFYTRNISIIRKSDYATSWFIYRSLSSWIKGVEKCYQIHIDKTKFQIIPAFFEDKDAVYSFLNTCHPGFTDVIE